MVQDQLSLFGGGPPQVECDAIGPLTPRRIDLDSASWLEHVPGFLRGHQTLMTTLVDAVTWVAQEREMYDKVVPVPRLMGKMATPPTILESIGRSLSGRYKVLFDNVTFALYRDGRDSVAFHGDRGAREVGQSHVVTLSLGTPRRFAVRPKEGQSGARRAFDLGHGDLMVMGGACQRTWDHAVTKVTGPRARHIGPRLVVMYRASSEWAHTEVNLRTAWPERTVRVVKPSIGLQP